MSKQELDNDQMMQLIKQLHEASLPQLQEIQKHVNHEISLELQDMDPDHDVLEPDEFFCDRCGRISKEPYETAAGDYVCQSCYTSGPEEDDHEWGDPDDISI